jgi:tripartite-type tricarboxylate transporter receptor subunit TctC
MGTLKRLLVVGAAIVLSAFALSGIASAAQTWPQRPVKFIVPLGPGSGTDVTARLVGDYLSRRWGHWNVCGPSVPSRQAALRPACAGSGRERG